MHDPSDPRLLWITGAGGFLGSIVARCASQLQLPALPLARSQLDLLDAAAVRQLAQNSPPKIILHCAALARSPECQNQPQRAYRANVQTVQHLMDAAPNARILLVSTDLVFDGRKGHYSESDPVNPLSVYAETKVAAEILLSQFPNHLIVRTSLNFGFSPSGDRSFNEEMARAWRQGRTLNLFTDEFRCPIAAIDTAHILLQLAQSTATGRLHVAGRDRLSRWQIGRALHQFYTQHPHTLPASSPTSPQLPPLPQAILPSSLAQYDGAPRPPDVSLDCTRAASLLGSPMPAFHDGLQRLAHSLSSPIPLASPS